MKNYSNCEIVFDAITNATGVKFLQVKEVSAESANEAEVDVKASAQHGEGSDEPDHPEKSGNGESEPKSVKVLTAMGIVLMSIFKTINAINALDLSRSSRILGEFEYSEYNLLNCLQVFIRPRKAVIGSETGVRQKDLLEDYQPFFAEAPNGGKVLSPTEFENAQLRLLRAINKKCVALNDVAPISRDYLVVTEEVLQQYPICSNGEVKAVAKSDVLRMFPLKYSFYEDDDYIAVYTERYVEDAMLNLGNMLVKAANQRNAEQ